MKSDANSNLHWCFKNADGLREQDLELVQEFFDREFPDVFGETNFKEILRWKLGSKNPAGTGHLSIAVWEDQVIGVASATKRIVSIDGEEILAVEVGDTFTSEKFRKAGRCETPFMLFPNITNETNTNYFVTSVFGRLMYETLFRSQEAGAVLWYGFPNQMSNKAYKKRFLFHDLEGSSIFSAYWFGAKAKTPFDIFGLTQKLLAKFILIATKITFRFQINEISSNEFINEVEGLNSFEDPSIIKSKEFLKYRYEAHPVDKYEFVRIASSKGLTRAVVIFKKSPDRNKILICDYFSKKRTHFYYLITILEIFKRNHRNIRQITAWFPKAETKLVHIWVTGAVTRRNVKPIVRVVQKTQIDTQAASLRFRYLGDSDNG